MSRLATVGRPRYRLPAAIALTFLLPLLAAGLPVGSRAAAVGAGTITAATTSDGFVHRDGSRLTLGASTFRFAGANLYWTGLDENVGGISPAQAGTVDYPSFFRIRDGLSTARAMGATVVRAHTLGVSLGTPKAMTPVIGSTNPAAFATIDDAVAEAKRLGLRLVVPLTDNWQYYHGGRFDVLRGLGLSTADDGALFYTDRRARAAYQSEVQTLLTHVNPRTGMTYAADPTVLGWDLGNELQGMTTEWVQANATFVKGLAPQQLVIAGQGSGVSGAVLAAPAVDISDTHYYPTDPHRMESDAARVTAAGKVFMAGELGSPGAAEQDWGAVTGDGRISGALYWSLFPLADHYGYVRHDDGYTLHYPGDTPAMRRDVAALRELAAAMTGQPMTDPATVAAAPLVTGVEVVGGHHVLTWRGGTGADGYLVQRAADGGGWTTITPTPLSANDAPWIDPTTPAGVVGYRILAVDRSGSVLRTSTARSVAGGESLVVDPLEDWYLTAAHTDDLHRTPDGTQVVVSPPAGSPGSVTWTRAGLRSATFELRAAYAPDLRVLVSPDGGSTWQAVSPAVRRTGTDAYELAVSGLSHVSAVRVDWPAGAAPAGLTGVVLTSD